MVCILIIKISALGLLIVLITLTKQLLTNNETKIDKYILAFALILSMSPLLLFVPIKTQTVHSYDIPIYAIKDNTQTIIRRYTIQTDSRYYYLSDHKDGKKMYSVSSNDSYIVESDTESPRIEVYKTISNNKIIQFLYNDSSILSKKEYKFVVPKGSITTDYNVDLEN